MIRIAIGADHRGFTQKEHIKNALSDYEWIDVGADSDARSDYPVFSHAVSHSISSGQATHGVLLCGSGIGMAIAANRHAGVYAGLAWNKEVAALAKEHDNVNVLVLPSDFISPDEAVKMIKAWLSASFRGGHYADRVAMIDDR